MEMTVETLACDPSLWPLLRDLITSDQMPPDRIAETVSNFPDFAAWMKGTQNAP